MNIHEQTSEYTYECEYKNKLMHTYICINRYNIVRRGGLATNYVYGLLQVMGPGLSLLGFPSKSFGAIASVAARPLRARPAM